MLSKEVQKHITDILKLLPHDDIFQLASTVTKSIILPENVEEAVEIILLHSGSAESLLTRKKVSKDVIFKYLSNKKVNVTPDADKRTLINITLQLWNCKHETLQSTETESFTSSMIRAEGDSTHLIKEENTLFQMGGYLVPINKQEESISVVNEHVNSASNLQDSEVNDMANEFTVWFYSLLNNYDVNKEEIALGVEHFWQDCNMHLIMTSETNSFSEEVIHDSARVVKLLTDTKIQHNLYFNPNLSMDGVKGQIDVHGLVKVLVCGTLHQQDKCVGIFDQSFGLIRDPNACNNWKIKFTELYLKSRNSVTSLPTLEGTELLVRNLALPNPTSMGT